jgi:hypothetical protein
MLPGLPMGGPLLMIGPLTGNLFRVMDSTLPLMDILVPTAGDAVPTALPTPDMFFCPLGSVVRFGMHFPFVQRKQALGLHPTVLPFLVSDQQPGVRLHAANTSLCFAAAAGVGSAALPAMAKAARSRLPCRVMREEGSNIIISSRSSAGVGCSFVGRV